MQWEAGGILSYERMVISIARDRALQMLYQLFFFFTSFIFWPSLHFILTPSTTTLSAYVNNNLVRQATIITLLYRWELRKNGLPEVMLCVRGKGEIWTEDFLLPRSGTLPLSDTRSLGSKHSCSCASLRNHHHKDLGDFSRSVLHGNLTTAKAQTKLTEVLVTCWN